MAATYPRIPYGEADIRRIRLKGWLYVDKTRFLHRLEEESYAFLIRPRRFGKSLWVSVLENYYDRTRADEWHAVFDGTDIGREPTEDRSRYVILRFNFSAFDDTLETLRERFEAYCEMAIRRALERNADLFPDAAIRRILAPPAADGRLGELFAYAGDHGIPLYGLIDEYDNFANTVLAHHGRGGVRVVHPRRRLLPQLLRHAEGRGRGERRSAGAAVHHGRVAGHHGRRDQRLQHRQERQPAFGVQRDARLHRGRGAGSAGDCTGIAACSTRTWTRPWRIMGEWYNGYRFARGARGDLYNTDMVLYYLSESVPNGSMPDNLIDVNVRIDYGKLRHLLVVNREAGVRFNGNFDLLRNIAGEGGGRRRRQSQLPARGARRAGELPVAAATTSDC